MTTPIEIGELLERARTLGFLGPGPLRVHLDHAYDYLECLPDNTERLIDLGSGGGLPGLPLLLELPEVKAGLLDSSQKRCAFLSTAVEELGIADRVQVINDRAERVGHDSAWRGWADVVVTRSFGAPYHAIECALPLLRIEGRICISEPPGGRVWPSDQLQAIGLRQMPSDVNIAVFEMVAAPPSHFPRSFKRQDRDPIVTPLRRE